MRGAAHAPEGLGAHYAASPGDLGRTGFALEATARHFNSYSLAPGSPPPPACRARAAPASGQDLGAQWLPGGEGANPALSPRSGRNPHGLPRASGPRALGGARSSRPSSGPCTLRSGSPLSTSRASNVPRPAHPSPGRGGERARAPLEVGGAARVVRNTFIERRPPFARASICFPEKQVTAGDASPAPALYLSPVNAPHRPLPPPATRFPAPKSRPPPPPPSLPPQLRTRRHSPPAPQPPRPGHTPLAASRSPSRRRSGSRYNGRDRPGRAARSDRGLGVGANRFGALLEGSHPQAFGVAEALFPLAPSTPFEAPLRLRSEGQGTSPRARISASEKSSSFHARELRRPLSQGLARSEDEGYRQEGFTDSEESPGSRVGERHEGRVARMVE
uniref:Uncharacterized protein n=1 Tax=Rangifer tarandus platyrhynchus TaxID=3082113 RepID=A0ACB0DZ62_RANTA|nr:unnamed protein product [Rangifer tarandus platyrhynchus]